jgi:hypothetical protein
VCAISILNIGGKVRLSAPLLRPEEGDGFHPEKKPALPLRAFSPPLARSTEHDLQEINVSSQMRLRLQSEPAELLGSDSHRL